MSNQGDQAGAKANQSQAAKKQTMASIMKKKKGNTSKVTIQIDGELASKIGDLRTRISLAEDYDKRTNDPDTAHKLREELQELIDSSRDSEVTFTFKSIGRVAYDDLVNDPVHQPTEEGKKEGAQFNPDTFPPALISVTCVDPEISLEDAVEIFSDESWNGAELQRLFFGALEVNTEVADIPLSRPASVGTAGLLSNLLTATD